MNTTRLIGTQAPNTLAAARPFARGLRACALAAVALAAHGCGGSEKPSSAPEVKHFMAAAQTLFDTQQYQKAYEEFTKALHRSETEDNLYGQVVCYLSLAQCKQRLGQLPEAWRLYKEAERWLPLMEKEQPNVDKQDLHTLLGKYHEIKGEMAARAGDWDTARAEWDAAEKSYRTALE